MARVNHAINPRMLGAAFNWAGGAGTATDTTSVTFPVGGLYRRGTLTTVGTGTTFFTRASGTGTSGVPVVYGETVDASVYQRVSAAGGSLWGISLVYYDAAGAQVGAGDTAYQGTPTADAWMRLRKTGAVPLGAAFVAVTARWSVPVAEQAVGMTFDVGAVLILRTPGVPAPQPGVYFDGDTVNTPDWTYSWSGPAHASTSLETATPGLYVVPVLGDPCPRVEITVTGLDAVGPSRVTVWRSTVGGKRRAVRGWKNRLVFGSDIEIDYEAPLGREIRYDLQVISGAVTPLRVSATCTLDATEGLIQDPLVPSSNVPLSAFSGSGLPVPTLAPTAFRKLTYDMGSSQERVLGSDTPVGFAGQRMVASGVDFSTLTDSAEQGTALRNLLMTAYPVLVRPLPEWGDLPDLLYLDVAQPSEEPLNAHMGGTLTRWTLTGDQVTPPSLSIVVPIWTYDQVQQVWEGYTYATQQSVAVGIDATYMDNQRDPTMGG